MRAKVITIQVYGSMAPAGIIGKIDLLMEEAWFKNVVKLHIFGIPSFSTIDGEVQPPTIRIINSTEKHLGAIRPVLHDLTQPPFNCSIEEVIDLAYS